MRNFRRLMVIAVAGLIGLVAIVLLGVNLYVQSRTAQARIQQELSQRLNVPLEIGQISVTPWGGLKLSQITIPRLQPGTSSDFLKADSFRLRIDFFSLFSRRLLIKEVSLVSPEVVWGQNSEGKWRLPELRESGHEKVTVESANLVRPEPARPSETVNPVTDAGPEIARPAKQATAKIQTEIRLPLIPELQRVNMKHGDFRFLNQSGDAVADFHRVDFRSSLHRSSAIDGTVKVAKIALRQRFFLENLQSPFTYEPDVLELSKMSARVGGGKITGQFAMQPETEDSPFTVSLRFQNVESDRIVTDAGGQKGTIQGKLTGGFYGSGKMAYLEKLTGNGEVSLHDGQLRRYNLLVALGQLLRIEELTQLRLDQAEARYHVADGVITIDELLLRSPNLRLTATGTVNLNGKLKLNSQLVINDKIRSQLFTPILASFRPLDEAGCYGVDFEMTGTLDHPKTNLMDQLLPRDLKNLVSGFLGNSGKRKKKKAAAAKAPVGEAETTPAPAVPP